MRMVLTQGIEEVSEGIRATVFHSSQPLGFDVDVMRMDHDDGSVSWDATVELCSIMVWHGDISAPDWMTPEDVADLCMQEFARELFITMAHSHSHSHGPDK